MHASSRFEFALLAVLGVAGASPSAARADQGSHSHAGQVGVHAQAGFGFRFIAPYDGEYCGQVDASGAPESVCSGRSPVTLELGAAYGVHPKLELLLDLRLGLERDFGTSPATAGPRQLALAPGLKIYHDDAGITKFFSTLQLALDFTDYGQAGGTDYGVRNVNGLQLDFHRTFGVYAYVGETLAFNRWFRFEFDAGIGIQARVP